MLFHLSTVVATRFTSLSIQTRLNNLSSPLDSPSTSSQRPTPTKRRSGSPNTTSYLPNASTARYTKRGLYIPLFVAAVVLFPLATTHTNNMSKIYHITRPSLYVKHYWVNADNWKDACKNIDNDKAHHESYDLIYHKAGYKSVSVTDSFGTYHQQNPQITT